MVKLPNPRFMALGPRRLFSTTSSLARSLRICVVGSGPAGFYTAERLLKNLGQSKVDIVERLPTPFGLVRSGVAPDHPETKSVINKFSEVATSERCKFYGNVRLGSDVSLEELRKSYDIVVLAYGAESDTRLGVEGEDLDGVHSAREFVWWYNGHPDCRELSLDLKRTQTAAIVGQGNVALDAARILLRSVDELATTDIAEHALKALRESEIRRVYIIGRRGPVQAACTTKEVRELLGTGLRDVDVFVKETDLQMTPQDENSKRAESTSGCTTCCVEQQRRSHPGRARNCTLCSLDRLDVSWRQKTVSMYEVSGLRKRSSKGRVSMDSRRRLVLVNLRTSSAGNQFFDLVLLRVGFLCRLVLKSIGYRCLPVPGLPFDQKRGIVPNLLGRVLGDNAKPEPGLYVVGWLKRGATGIIGTNVYCADEVVASIEEDVKNGRVPDHIKGSTGGISSILENRNKRIVSFDDWERLNQEEVNRGAAKGKPREKLVGIDDALAILGG